VSTSEHFETGSKKVGRGMAQRSLDLIEAMREIAEAAQPITGRQGRASGPLCTALDKLAAAP
jgi:hypothetical protein